GDRVGLLSYGRKLQQRLGPGRGTPHLRALVEHLALVRGEPSEADHGRAAETLLAAQKRRSLIIWLTDLAETPATPDVIESALQMTTRHLVLFGLITSGVADRKSTRLNSSHVAISYAVFCLKKKIHSVVDHLRLSGPILTNVFPHLISSPLLSRLLARLDVPHTRCHSSTRSAFVGSLLATYL